MLILGRARCARPDGAAMLALARALAESDGMVQRGWNGFNMLHTAAARVGGLDLGFVPGPGGRDVAGILDGCRKGAIDVVYLLGADEIDVRRSATPSWSIRATMAIAGAHRADVILPGAAYTEKNAHLRQYRGPRAAGRRAVFPPGEAQEDWTILRALSEALGSTLPYDSLASCAPGCSRPTSGLRSASTRSSRRAWGAVRRERRRSSAPPFAPADHQLLHDRPDQPRLRDHGRVRRDLSCAAAARRSRPAPMDDFWPRSSADGRSPSREILAIVVPLLLAVAYLTYAERKVLAAMQLRRGPNVVGPFGLLQPFADGAQAAVQGDDHPERRQPRRLHAGADDHLHPGAGRLGGDPVRPRLGASPTSMSASSICSRSRSLGVYGIIMAGWASQLEISLPGRAALGGADGLLRGLHRLRHRSPCCCWSAR